MKVVRYLDKNTTQMIQSIIEYTHRSVCQCVELCTHHKHTCNRKIQVLDEFPQSTDTTVKTMDDMDSE